MQNALAEFCKSSEGRRVSKIPANLEQKAVLKFNATKARETHNALLRGEWTSCSEQDSSLRQKEDDADKQGARTRKKIADKRTHAGFEELPRP